MIDRKELIDIMNNLLERADEAKELARHLEEQATKIASILVKLQEESNITI